MLLSNITLGNAGIYGLLGYAVVFFGLILLMIVVMLLGVTAMFGNVAEDLFWYCIPLYNSVQCMSGIFSFQLSVTGLWLTVAVNLTVALLGVFVLTRMFHSEKVIFSK